MSHQLLEYYRNNNRDEEYDYSDYVEAKRRRFEEEVAEEKKRRRVENHLMNEYKDWIRWKLAGEGEVSDIDCCCVTSCCMDHRANSLLSFAGR